MPRHVCLHGHEMRQFAGVVADGGDGQLVPEGRPVFSVIAQGDLNRALVSDGFPQLIDFGAIRERALEKPAVEPNDFLFGVSRKLQEGGVGVNDRMIGEMGIRQNKGVLQHLGGAQPGALFRGESRAVCSLIRQVHFTLRECINCAG